MNRTRLYIAVMTLPFIFSSAWTQEDLSAGSFVAEAKNQHAFGIAAGKLALEKSRIDEVRDFARMMVEDHTLAAKRLAEAAPAEAAKAPVQTAPAASPHADNLPQEGHNIMINALQDDQVDGVAFNQVYLDSQIKVLDESMTLYRRYLNSGGRQALAAYAEEMVPKLENQRTLANQLQQSLDENDL